ncbi:MAG: DUF3450 family protein [Planctomycetes bacterium]|nr:DUF3450 family protein [Planctomycetota bacterium]
MRALVATTLLCALAGASLAGDDPIENLAKELVEKRGAVERLATEVDLSKTELKDALRSRALQRADLERQLHALEVEREELSRKREAAVAAITSKRASGVALTPVVRGQIAALRGHVEASIPFKRAERLRDLEALAADLDAERTSPHEALGRLWRSYEDELRLTRENGLYRQQVEIDGEPQLADVVKLGTVLLYVRTLEGNYAAALPTQAGWVFRLLDPADQERVRALFDALEKHVRQGFFELPNPYVKIGGTK